MLLQVHGIFRYNIRFWFTKQRFVGTVFIAMSEKYHVSIQKRKYGEGGIPSEEPIGTLSRYM